MIPLPPHDAALPGLTIALDGDAMHELLEQCLSECALGELAVESCRPSYIRYKPGVSCLVSYELSLRQAGSSTGAYKDAGSSPHTVDRAGEPASERATVAHIRLYAGDRASRTSSSPSFRRLLERAGRRHPWLPAGGAVYLPVLGATLQLYPVDAELPALVRAASGRKMRRVLTGAMPDATAVPLTTVQPLLVRYKPARKALLRYVLDGGREVYGKLQTHGRGAELLQFTRALRAAGVPTPAAIAYLQDLRMLVHEAATGSRWTDLRGRPEFDTCLEPAAEVLAYLHGAGLRALPHHSLCDEGEVVTMAAQGIRSLLPALGDRVVRLASDIARCLAQVTERQATIHGDFYDDQVLVSDSGVVLLDFDEARLGHPLIDVGNFLAHQARFDVPTGREHHGGRETFLDAYARRLPDVKEAALFEAAAMLKLASGPFRRLECDWPREVERLVALSEATLAQYRRNVHSVGSLRSNDSALPQLRALTDPVHMGEVLRSVLRDEPADLAALEVVRHKPGRRCLLRYELRLGAPGAQRRERLWGKTFASRRGPRVYEITSSISQARACGPAVVVPEPVAYLPELKLMLQRDVPGEPLGPRLLNGDSGIARRVAEALHSLHSSGLDLGRGHTLANEIEPLAARVDRLSGASPQVASLARRCLGLIETQVHDAGTGWRSLPVHRDFYHDQVLTGEHGLSVLDFDDAAMSEPALDVANFLAHLQLLSLQARGTPAALGRVASAFRARYTELDPQTDGELVRFLEGATLLRLAEIHLPRARGAWVAQRLLEESERLLDRRNETSP